MIPIFFLIACAISAVASVTDVWRFKVYNALTFPAMTLGIAYHSFAPEGRGWQYGLVGCAVGMGILVIPYLFGVFGAGDAKFVGAVGAWLGIEPVMTALLVGALASGVYALALLVFRGGLTRAWVNLRLTLWTMASFGKLNGEATRNETVQEVTRTSDRRSRLVPFSAMISIGVVYAVITFVP